MIELAGEPGTIAAERLDLRRQRFLAAIGLAPPLGRRLQRIERQRQPPARDLDRIGLAHLAIRCGHPRRRTQVKIVRRQLFINGTLRRIEQERQRLKRFSRWPVHDAVRTAGRAFDFKAPRMLSVRRLFP